MNRTLLQRGNVTLQPQVLDITTLPLYGVRLIEASAGTGKTFTLAALYLRLLLGLGGQYAYSRPLLVDEILVVTFTEAAIQELRARIRKNIHELRLACLRNTASSPLYASLLAQIEDRQEAALRLLIAERQIDTAAIYTIHGFCQRVLNTHALSIGIPFTQTVLLNEKKIRQQACADFWRRCCYRLPIGLVQTIQQEWRDPSAVLQALSPYLQGDIPILLPQQEQESLLTRYRKIVAQQTEVKQQWKILRAEIEGLITTSGVSKQSYSRRNLPRWLVEVDHWVEQQREGDILPKALTYFRASQLRSKTKEGQCIPQHPLFDLIDQLYDPNLQIRELLFTQGLHQVRENIQREKKRQGVLGYDDLLMQLDRALRRSTGQQLADRIRQQYPLAMVDEFQDTDPQQYRIFQHIYAEQERCGLLLIGDPKQAIYAFRGADIFTYLRARQGITQHYTLQTNWRSTTGMVQAVNHLFSYRPAPPFVFHAIPFYPVKPAAQEQSYFSYAGQSQPALQFYIQPEMVNATVYAQTQAVYCAAQIRDWLQAGERGDACFIRGEDTQPVRAADIAILVRNRVEANLMQEALRALSIPSVYLSNRDSVLSTPEARELLWLLQAVLSPENERLIRCALASSLMGENAHTLEQLYQDEQAWEPIVDEFMLYRRYWQQRGILPMLREWIHRRKIAERLLIQVTGERRLTDVLHIGELLQEASIQLDNEHALVRWLAQQIEEPDQQADNQQIRLESDRHVVKIITFHKSKGLEYPLVMLPFVSQFRAASTVLYHDRTQFNAILDLQQRNESLELAEQERLAEDLRLLYVGITRAIYHCVIGVAVLPTTEKESNQPTACSAIEYLVLGKRATEEDNWSDALAVLADENIGYRHLEPTDDTLWSPVTEGLPHYTARQFTRPLEEYWQVISYSSLQQQSAQHRYELLPKLTTERADSTTILASTPLDKLHVLDRHTFPKGATAGSFLHSLLEKCDFSKVIDEIQLVQSLTLNGVDHHWLYPLSAWLSDIIQAPLNSEGFCLQQLTPACKLVELDFHLPVRHPLKAQELDKLVKHFDPISAQCETLTFRQVEGVLKGFIDLVCCWNGRYYIVDYKSNWLGDSCAAYTQSAMFQAMCEHRYDLQYQFYTLALHRYLRQRIPNYDYEQHFGGVFYLFLRGLSAYSPEQGVFYCRPPWQMVEKLDRYFDVPHLAQERS